MKRMEEERIVDETRHLRAGHREGGDVRAEGLHEEEGGDGDAFRARGRWTG